MFVILEYGGVCFKLFCVYAPVDKKGRLDLFEKMKFFLEGRDPIIVLGDFNCTLRSGDRCGGGGGSQDVDKSGKELGEILQLFGLRDWVKVVVFLILVIGVLCNLELIFVSFQKICSQNLLSFNGSLSQTMVRSSVL